MDGSGLTDTHFLLALDITRRTRRSLVQLRGREGGWLGRLSDLQGEDGLLTSGAQPACAPAGACSPVPGLGTAVLEVFVRLHHLPVPPALAAHKLHLQVKGAGPMRPWGTLWGREAGEATGTGLRPWGSSRSWAR